MITVELEYCVIFGKCDASDWNYWEAKLDGEAEKAYLTAKKLRLPFSDFSDLDEESDKIAQQETEYGNEFGDEYSMECSGRIPVDPDEINELVKKRDRHTIEFFGLLDMSDEELDTWDANELDDLPYVSDFYEDFEPDSPFDEGWTLEVRFCEEPEMDDLDDEEARQTFTELLKEAKGDYSVVEDYIDRAFDFYVGEDHIELAVAIAEELGLHDFIDYLREKEWLED